MARMSSDCFMGRVNNVLGVKFVNKISMEKY